MFHSGRPSVRRHPVAATLLAGLALLLVPRSASATDVFTDLGGALAGVSGDPHLAGSGTLQAGVLTTISLSNAAPGAPAALFLSLSTSPAPFKGGVLQTVPVLAVFAFATDGAGSVVLGFSPNPSLPTDLEFYLQYAILDGAAVHGVSLSNALRAHVPAPGPAISSFAPLGGPAGTPITLDGAGFSADPADIIVSVGGLLPTPIAGSATSWTGVLGTIPLPDIMAEAIQVVSGNGQMIGPGVGQFHFPTITGITSTGSGQLWTGNTKLHSFTTSSLFNKTDSPNNPDLAVNQYAPNGALMSGSPPHVLKVVLPLGAAWGPTAHAAFNFLFQRTDGTSFALSLDNVSFDSSQTVADRAAGLATIITTALGTNGSAAAVFTGGIWTIEVTPTGVPLVMQVCGANQFWTN